MKMMKYTQKSQQILTLFPLYTSSSSFLILLFQKVEKEVYMGAKKVKIPMKMAEF